jgi:hypothetical protein
MWTFHDDFWKNLHIAMGGDGQEFVSHSFNYPRFKNCITKMEKMFENHYLTSSK